MTPIQHPLTEEQITSYHGLPGSGEWYRDARHWFDVGREYERKSIPLADPHHDPRPWQDCTREDIREGDLVEVRCGTILHVGIARHLDEDGCWGTADGTRLIFPTVWPLRRIPAPTPPAEEVELPSEHPAHLLDVEGEDGNVCAYMALDGYDDWRGVDQGGKPRTWPPRWIAAFTLPDGTRARRDGEHEDGSPRFVKEAAK